MVHRPEVPHLSGAIWKSQAIDADLSSQRRRGEDDNPELEIIMGFQNFRSHICENAVESCAVFTAALFEFGNFFAKSPENRYRKKQLFDKANSYLIICMTVTLK